MVAQTVSDTLGDFEPVWRDKLKERGERILKEIADQRRGQVPARPRGDRTLDDTEAFASSSHRRATIEPRARRPPGRDAQA